MLEITTETVNRLPPRDKDSHKGDYGRALLIGGSRGMSGAIAISGIAALRSGAGLVTIAAPENCVDKVATFHPAYMTAPLPCDGAQISSLADDNLRELAEGKECLAIGPGLGRSNQLTALVSRFYREVDEPMVVDADGLNALAGEPEALQSPIGPRVLTPHPGEFKRLAEGLEMEEGDSIKMAEAMARKCQSVVVLKGSQTIVTDGKRTMQNTTGNPGMATAGAGDVLTGVVTALISQGMAPFDAAGLAVFVHGLAGDLAVAKKGEIGMIATDIIDFLPDAFAELQS